MATYDPNMNGGMSGDGHTEGATRDFGQASFSSWSFKDILSEMGDQARRLVRAEVELARTELKEEVTKVKASAGLLAGGGVALFLGAIAFVIFAIAVLTYVMPLWLSALLVTVALLVAGGLALKAGLKSLKKVHAPNRTIRTLKEDSQWASRTVQSMKSQMQGHA
jgi:uncharacterized membrane protein YqjE